MTIYAMGCYKVTKHRYNQMYPRAAEVAQGIKACAYKPDGNKSITRIHTVDRNNFHKLHS